MEAGDWLWPPPRGTVQRKEKRRQTFAFWYYCISGNRESNCLALILLMKVPPFDHRIVALRS